MPVMRAKMKVESVTQHGGGETLKMHAVCKNGAYPEDGSDEDNTFAKFSPSASLEIYIANPALFGKFKPGQKLYVDFTESDQ
jgi:hypothetical protein